MPVGATAAALHVDAAPLTANLEEDVRLDRAAHTRLRGVLDPEVHPATCPAQATEGAGTVRRGPWSLHQARGHDQLGSDRVAASPVAQVREAAYGLFTVPAFTCTGPAGPGRV